MEENHEMPCSSKSIPFTKVFAIALCDQTFNVGICDWNKIFEEKFGKVCDVDPLTNMYDRSKTCVHITFHRPEYAELAIQAKMIKIHNEIPVYIFPAHDEHQAIKFDSPIPCTYGHIHYLPFPLLAEQNHMEADTSLLHRSSLGQTEDQCSSNEKESLPESTDNVGIDDECKITILNDHCLRHVFSFLDKRELIKIERVCKWWQSVSLSCWSSFKEIIIRDIVPEKLRMTLEMLKCVLKRCGKYVKILDIMCHEESTDRAIYYDYREVDYIAEYCSSLRELYIKDADICPVSCRALSNAVKQLEILHLSGCHELNESLRILFTKCQNLRELYLTNMFDFSAKCLSLLNPNTMEKLRIYQQCSVAMYELVPALKRMKNLTCLEIDDFVISSCEAFSSVTKCVPNLKHFVYRDNHNCFVINDFNKTFGNLVNLTYLNVCRNLLITDRVLLEIISNCVNIKKLVLSGCGARTEQKTVTDFGVRKLVNLRQLEDLSLSYLKYITDHSLEALALAGRLIKLEIHANSKITDDGCGKIVSLCNYLEHFDMSDCDNITDSTVMAAEVAVESRTSDKALNLIVGGTRVSNVEKWKNVSPLLIVDPSNRSDWCAVLEMNDIDNGYFDTPCYIGNDPDFLEWFA